MTSPDHQARQRQLDAEAAAVVLTIVAALAASNTTSTDAPGAPTIWADPAHRLGVGRPSATGWWASGMPR